MTHFNGRLFLPLTISLLRFPFYSFPDDSFSSRDNTDGGLVAVDDCFDCMTGFVVGFAAGLALGFADPLVLGSS